MYMCVIHLSNLVDVAGNHSQGSIVCIKKKFALWLQGQECVGYTWTRFGCCCLASIKTTSALLDKSADTPK